MDEIIYLVIENGESIIYSIDEKKRVHRRIHDNSLIKYVKLETNGIAHINLINKYMKSRDFEHNFINQITNPINNLSFCEGVLKIVHKKKKFDIRSFYLPDSKRGTKKNVGMNFLVNIEAEIFMSIIDNIDKFTYHDGVNRSWYQRFLDIEDNEKFKQILHNKDILKELIASKDNDVRRKLKNDEWNDFFWSFYYANVCLTEEHIGRGLFKNDSYSSRIYLNIKNQEILSQFLKEYIRLCIRYKIDYDMKGIKNDDSLDDCDTTVLYCNPEDLLRKIFILESIIEKHPEWLDEVGDPPLACGRLGTGFYGISHSGSTLISNPFACQITYNDFFDELVLVAYYRMLAVLLTKKFKFKNKELQEALVNFSEFNNPLFTLDRNVPSEITFCKVSFVKYKSLIDNILTKVGDFKDQLDKDIESNAYKYSELFKESMNMLSNITQGREKNSSSNIAISKYMEDYFTNLKNGYYEGMVTLPEWRKIGYGR